VHLVPLALCPAQAPCRRISLASRLPSVPSAASPLALFGHLVGTMQPLDSPAAFISDLYLLGFSERSADCTDATGVSRFSRVEFLCMHGVYDSAGSRRTCLFSHTASCPSG